MKRSASATLFVVIIAGLIAILILLVQLKIINVGSIFSFRFFKTANSTVDRVLNKTNEVISKT